MALIDALISNVDVYALYLPFLFVFAVFYALLVKTKVFGSGAYVNRINAIVALIISLYVVIFSPFAPQISVFFASMFAMGAISIVTLLMFVMLVGLLLGPFVTKEEGWQKLGKKMLPILVIVAFLFTIGLFFSSAAMASWFGDVVAPSFGIGLSGEDVALIALIVITVIILYWLTAGEEPGKGIKLGVMD
jgi:hypothetical protein